MFVFVIVLFWIPSAISNILWCWNKDGWYDDIILVAVCMDSLRDKSVSCCIWTIFYIIYISQVFFNHRKTIFFVHIILFYFIFTSPKIIFVVHIISFYITLCVQCEKEISLRLIPSLTRSHTKTPYKVVKRGGYFIQGGYKPER